MGVGLHVPPSKDSRPPSKERKFVLVGMPKRPPSPRDKCRSVPYYKTEQFIFHPHIFINVSESARNMLQQTTPNFFPDCI